MLVWRAGATNRVVVPARQAENRLLGSLKGLQIQMVGGIDSLESIPGLLNRIQIRAQTTTQYGMFEQSTSLKRPADDTVNETG
jgi:hypothetical protein